MAATLDARIRLDSSQYTGGLNRVLRETNSAVGKISQQFGTLRNVLGGGLAGGFALQMAGSLVTATVEAEKLQAAMAATAGSAELGNKYLTDVRQLAGDIGLDVSAAAKAMIMFTSAGMTAAESMKTLKDGFNAIASSGGGAAEFSRFSVAIQQLRNSPKPLQEEINQLREALPTTAKLMKDAFGVQRAEDLQKLGITGKQFVEGFLAEMSKLPQIGDTLGKEIGRFQAQWEQFKATMGDSLKPTVEGLATSATFLMQAITVVNGALDDGISKLFGWSDAMIEGDKRSKLARAEMMESVKTTQEAINKLIESQKQDAAAKDKSIEQGNKLREVYDKFATTMGDAAKKAKELSEELLFQDRMDAANKSSKGSAWNDALDETRRKTTESINAKRGAAGDAAAQNRLGIFDAIGMNEENARGLRDAMVEDVKRGPRRRSDDRRAERQDELARIKAADELTRKQLREERAERRKNGFKDLKENKDFINDAERAKELKKANRANFKNDGQKAVDKLIDIHNVLLQLSKA